MAGAAAHPRKKPDPARPPIFTSTAPPRFVLSNEPVQAETDPTRAQIVELLERSGLPTPESKRSGEMLREALDRSGVEGVKLGDVKCFQAGCWVDVDYRQRDVFSKFDEEKIQNPRSKFRESPYASGRTSLLVTREKRLFATWYFILVDQ